MLAILVHFLGHLVVDSALPPWVGSADAYFLAMWYAGFAAVDLIAAGLATDSRMRAVLAMSFAWSAALVVEQLMLRDSLQSSDGLVQSVIDTSLLVYFVVMLFRLKSGKEIKA